MLSFQKACPSAGNVAALLAASGRQVLSSWRLSLSELWTRDICVLGSNGIAGPVGDNRPGLEMGLQAFVSSPRAATGELTVGEQWNPSAVVSPSRSGTSRRSRLS